MMDRTVDFHALIADLQRRQEKAALVQILINNLGEMSDGVNLPTDPTAASISREVIQELVIELKEQKALLLRGPTSPTDPDSKKPEENAETKVEKKSPKKVPARPRRVAQKKPALKVAGS